MVPWGLVSWRWHRCVDVRRVLDIGTRDLSPFSAWTGHLSLNKNKKTSWQPWRKVHGLKRLRQRKAARSPVTWSAPLSDGPVTVTKSEIKSGVCQQQNKTVPFSMVNRWPYSGSKTWGWKLHTLFSSPCTCHSRSSAVWGSSLFTKPGEWIHEVLLEGA